MTYLKLVLAGILIFAIGALAGMRYGKSQTVTTEKSVETNKTRTTIVQTQTAKGDVKTVTTIDSTTIAAQDKKSKETIAPSLKLWGISALAMYDKNADKRISYGASVSKQVVGPITAGLFGFDNGTLGVSVGFNF